MNFPKTKKLTINVIITSKIIKKKTEILRENIYRVKLYLIIKGKLKLLRVDSIKPIFKS